MQTETITATAPVVTAETSTTTNHRSQNRRAIIPARKSLMGEWKKAGAPPKDVIGLSKNRKRGAFTKHDIFSLNGETVSLLTITKRIKALRKAGELVKMATAAKTESPGRPAQRFNFDLTQGEAKKSRNRKVKAETTPAPVVAPEVQPAPMPAAAPAEPTPVVVVPATEQATAMAV